MNTKTAEKPRAAEAKVPAEQQNPPLVPTTAGSNPLPAASSRTARLEANAGQGVSRDREDKFVPMIRVLQSQSPQCLRQKPEYIAGAEAGDFYLKNTLTPLIKGSDGFLFQPCTYLKCWLEFDGPRDERPNFVARHDHDDQTKRPRGVGGLHLDEKDGYDYVNDAGHRFTFSREHYGFVDGRPFVFPFGGSGHTTSREWQTMMDQFRLPSGNVEPSYNRKYKITTFPRSNDSGDWFGVRVEPERTEVSDQEFDMGEAFYKAVMGGERGAENPPAEGDGGETMADQTEF